MGVTHVTMQLCTARPVYLLQTNQLLTYLGWVHMAFQPFVANWVLFGESAVLCCCDSARVPAERI
jgi:hypothetical protein